MTAPESAEPPPSPGAPDASDASPDAPDASDAAFEVPGATLAIKIVVGLALIGGTFFVLAALYHEPLEAAALSLAERYGVGFVFAGVLLVDVCPFPLLSEPVLGAAVAGGLTLAEIGLAVSLGSVSAAGLGYAAGLGLRRLGLADRILGRHTPAARRFVSKYGFWGIALAALTPLPFALCTWTAGTLRMRLLPFVLGALFRVPKTWFYLWVVAETWRLGRGG